MDDSRRAMASWLGTLAQGGILKEPIAQAGEALAAFVVGEEALLQLRLWLRTQPDEIASRERRTAIEVCIWMAHADREVHAEEREMLRELVTGSALDEDTQDALVQAVHEPPSLDGVEARLTHPILRELLLALAWELAQADGRVDDAEKEGYAELTRRLGISHERADQIKRAICESI
jgi:tellurite resistance protein